MRRHAARLCHRISNVSFIRIFQPYHRKPFKQSIRPCAFSLQFHSSTVRLDCEPKQPVFGGDFHSSDTIYALSTASGRAGIAIIRISGSASLDIYKALCPSKPIPKPRYATVRTLYDPLPGLGSVLDSDALILYFPSPGTVTGEDVLELQIHGGPAIVKAVLSAISRCSPALHARYAEPGEFTKRAFHNGRLDLAQVEALSDALSAETEQQRRAAIRGNSGALGLTYEAWRLQLLSARGELEAIIDFSEDQDFEGENASLLQNIKADIQAIRKSIRLHEEGSRQGELLRKGIRVSLLGPPNAGKSSLLNRIVGREASIVSTEAGTTRDIVETSLDIRGYLCNIADTAGLRSGGPSSSQTQVHSIKKPIGAVEKEGIKRAKARATESDVVIALAYIERAASGKCYIKYEEEALKLAAAAPKAILVVNKVDLVPERELGSLISGFHAIVARSLPALTRKDILCMSCKIGDVDDADGDYGNVKFLIQQLVESFTYLTTTDYQDLFGVTERQCQLLVKCDGHLKDYLSQVDQFSQQEAENMDIVLAAESLRSAADCLSRITGRGDSGDVEEVLGVVFEKFCVGK